MHNFLRQGTGQQTCKLDGLIIQKRLTHTFLGEKCILLEIYLLFRADNLFDEKSLLNLISFLCRWFSSYNSIPSILKVLVDFFVVFLIQSAILLGEQNDLSQQWEA